MDFETLVQTRRSVRGFKKQPVPRAVIEEIIEVAKRAVVDEHAALAHPCADG